jgi:hypothetical protein|tara:strand:- start:215 stop:733 length:519 start_codon:yes stop_codon:yes gene_type:complete
MNKSKRINYMNPSFEMDFTNLERLPTDTGIPLIDRLNTELNEQAEELELIFTEIACENLDNPRKCAFYKELKRGSLVDTGLSDGDKVEIYSLYGTGNFTKTELQEMFGVKRGELNRILGDKTNRLGAGAGFLLSGINAQAELYQRNIDKDDFDSNDADYLAILAEVNNNPRD